MRLIMALAKQEDTALFMVKWRNLQWGFNRQLFVLKHLETQVVIKILPKARDPLHEKPPKMQAGGLIHITK